MTLAKRIKIDSLTTIALVVLWLYMIRRHPASDGYHNWSGKHFETFSSNDLVNWMPEGTIMDLTTDVIWADRNAWAPTIEEKEINNLGGLKESYVRTPSFVTSEAVLASENLVFNQKLTDAHDYNTTILPFTINVVAAMYFAPVFFNKRLARDRENHENYRRTTDAFEVATLALRTWDKTGDVRHFFVGEHVEGIQFRKGTK